MPSYGPQWCSECRLVTDRNCQWPGLVIQLPLEVDGADKGRDPNPVALKWAQPVYFMGKLVDFAFQR